MALSSEGSSAPRHEATMCRLTRRDRSAANRNVKGRASPNVSDAACVAIVAPRRSIIAIDASMRASWAGPRSADTTHVSVSQPAGSTNGPSVFSANAGHRLGVTVTAQASRSPGGVQERPANSVVAAIRRYSFRPKAGGRLASGIQQDLQDRSQTHHRKAEEVRDYVFAPNSLISL